MIKPFLNRIARLLHIKRCVFVEGSEGKESPATISFAISVCDEAEPLRRLLDILTSYCRPGDEIVIQADSSKVTKEVQEVIQAYRPMVSAYAEHPLNFDFAQAKNHLNTLCHGDWIFQLDADECPSSFVMDHLRTILDSNAEVELIKLPRINVFVNETDEVEESHVAWPDYQGRLYRNIPQRILWHRPLHEKIQGYKAYTYLPKDDRYAILHSKNKEQDKQKWQNWKEHYR